MHFAVSTAVIPVNVTEHRRCHHRVVERSVEYCAVILILGRDGDFAYFLIPRFIGGHGYCVKVPVGILADKVKQCILGTDGRHACLDQQRRTSVRGGD